jgi:mRNA interferase HigB
MGMLYIEAIMRIRGRKLIDDFARKHADTRKPLNSWQAMVKDKSWSNSAELKLDFPHASVLDNQTVVFDIKGNRYPLLSKITYKLQAVQVIRLGTHSEYDKWDL